MPHILFIDLSSTGVRAVAEALRLHHHVSVILPRDNLIYRRDGDSDAILGQVHNLIHIPTAISAMDLAHTVRRVNVDRRVDAAICLAEWTCANAAQACELAGVPFTSAQSVRTCRNKLILRNRLGFVGMGGVTFAPLSSIHDLLEFASKVGYPLVVKPVSGMGSLLVSIIRDERGIPSAWERIAAHPLPARPDFEEVLAQGLMVEEYIQGTLLSVEIARNKHGVFPLAVTGRVRAREDDSYELGFEVPPVMSRLRQMMCIEFARQAVVDLGLDLGLFHIEMIDSDAGPRLIDANPRLIGGDGARILEKATGQSFYELLLKVHLGQDLGGTYPLPIQRCVSTRKVEAAGHIDGIDMQRLRDIYAQAQKDSSSFDLTYFSPESVAEPGHVIARFHAYSDTADGAAKLATDMFEKTCEVLGRRIVA